MFLKNSVLRCFAVFCEMLCRVLCACFFSVLQKFYTKQHKTDQKVYKTHKTSKIRFVQYSSIRCCASFSHSENVYKKHSQNTSKNIAKHPQNTAKHCFLFFKKHSQNTTKHPQNTAKHRKTPQNTFANKTDRSSQQTAPLPTPPSLTPNTQLAHACLPCARLPAMRPRPHALRHGGFTTHYTYNYYYVRPPTLSQRVVRLVDELSRCPTGQHRDRVFGVSKRVKVKVGEVGRRERCNCSCS